MMNNSEFKTIQERATIRKLQFHAFIIRHIDHWMAAQRHAKHTSAVMPFLANILVEPAVHVVIVIPAFSRTAPGKRGALWRAALFKTKPLTTDYTDHTDICQNHDAFIRVISVIRG